MEIIRVLFEVIGACALLSLVLHQARKAIVKLISEGGSFISEIKKATRKAYQKIKNS